MILEAFAEYIRTSDPKVPATDILARWLWERLAVPPKSNVDRVLHCEIKVEIERNLKNQAISKQTFFGEEYKPYPRSHEQGTKSVIFKGRSESGKRLLKSLYEYCLSYEQHKWSRFVHNLKASDFNQLVR